MKKAARAKEKILDAAEQIVLDKKSSNFSLEAVAQKAGISKGGLFYHFSSKEILIKALIKRHLERITLEREKVRHLFSESPLGDVQAHLHALNTNYVRKNKMNASLFAIAAHDLSLLEPIRDFHKISFSNLKKNHSKWLEIFSLRAAIYGMWYMSMFGILPLTDAEFQKVADYIMKELENI